MRDSKKNDQGNHIAEQYTIHDNIPDISSESWKKVVDGGMLLHKLPWQIGNIFSSILDSYVNHANDMGKGKTQSHTVQCYWVNIIHAPWLPKRFILVK